MKVLAPKIESDAELPIVSFCNKNGVNITDIGDYGTWPHTDTAIIEFEGGIFCYVVSFADRTVARPEDGAEVRAEVYGTPVSWASYESETVIIPKPSDPEDGRTYTALRHETTYSVAQKLRKYGISEADFVEHNDIGYGDLIEGRVYHLPIAIPKLEPTISYEVYDSPVQKYISRPGGAQKWAFGNVRTLKDITSGSGMYPENKVFMAVALANVPVEDEYFAYYMDELALGDFRTTGKVKYMIGFAHGDLKDGTPPTPAPTEPSDTIAKQIETVTAPLNIVEPPAVKLDEVLTNPDEWKTTWQTFKNDSGLQEQRMYVITLPADQTEILVHDLDQKRPAKKLKNGGHYLMAGTIWKDGVEYARPWVAVNVPVEKRNYYAVPTDAMTLYDELYAEPDLNTRIAMHSDQLTPTERYVIPTLAATKLSYDRLKLYGRQFINKNKENKK